MRTLLGLLVLATGPAAAQPPAASPVTLFANVMVFDGTADRRTGPVNVLVRGNVIEKISAGPIPTDRRADTTVIDGGGRTLMPGLIDAHTHLAMASLPVTTLLTADAGYLHLHAGKEAERTLLRGFTSVRDVGGPVFGLKRAVDEGLVRGPRIWPSGAMISQTAGHADFRMPYDVPKGGLSRAEVVGAGRVADGVPAVLQAVREQLLQGASQVKLAAGGGVSSNYDPVDVSQYTEDELRAAVRAADDWGTYVLVHAYTPAAVRRAVAAGVKCVEHGQLMDEDTVKLMAAKGVWLSTQPFLDDEDANPKPDPAGRRKQRQVQEGTDVSIRLAVKHGVKIAWGTDSLFDAAHAAKQGKQLAKMAKWFEPAAVLRMATSGNAELLALSGPRAPYPGKLGVVAEGALADLLLVDGDPLADLSLVADPGKNFRVIMKDGTVYKNTLTATAK
jgi:imidazolonepropionase-like amidohydrolase